MSDKVERGLIKIVKRDGKKWLEIVTILRSSGEETVDRFTFKEVENFVIGNKEQESEDGKEKG